MATQRVVWTLLPNGMDANSKRAKASVLVSPRLTLPATTPSADLGQFPGWLDWPAVINAASFKVRTGSGVSIKANVTSSPDSKIWQAIFTASTFVKPWVFDPAQLKDKLILSYPVSAVTEMVEKLYGQVGIDAREGVPARFDLATAINGVRPFGTGAETGGVLSPGYVRPKPMSPDEVINRLRRERKRLDTKRFSSNPKARARSGLRADNNQVLDLLQAYHTPLQAEKTEQYEANQQPDNYNTKFPGKPNPFRHAKWQTRKRAALPAISDFKQMIDFHQIVAALCQYSELNRLCGLVLDIEFDLPSGIGATETFSLEVDWQSAANSGSVNTEEDVAPKIIANVSKTVFQAAKRNAASPIIGRYLNLSNSDYSLVQMDVDGAGMKLKNLRESLKRDVPVEYEDDSFEVLSKPTAGLPSLRTAGLMLAEKRRDLTITAGLHSASLMQSDLVGTKKAPTLYAEDIIRGYRADIQDSTSKKWHSVFFRQTRFKFTHTGKTHITGKEEGMARIAAAGSADNSNSDVIKIHEALINWTGWSLAAPEPGKLIKTDDSVGNDKEHTPTGLPLETRHSVVPGTLPRLRFGQSYRMRVRLVDLAGVSVPFSQTDIQPKGTASKSVKFLRHEPVEPPALALVSEGGIIDPLHEGESMQQIAIRTWNDTPNKNQIKTTQKARRHVVPTRVGHRFAEMHGTMDTGGNGTLDKSIFSMLIALDKPLAEIAVDRGKAAGTKRPERYSFADQNFELPYLPDPLAIAVAIRVVGAEGLNPNVIHKIPLYCDGGGEECKWPYARPFKIVLGELNAADANFNLSSREFRIPLRKAERAKVYLSCLMPKNAMEMLAVYRMILKRNPNQNIRKQIEERIRNGQHWMFTPWRVVDVVHAVQKPLITPIMINLSVTRKLGDTAANPGIEGLPLHAKSTTQVDMLGEWREPVDDPADLQAADGPYSVSLKAHGFSKKIARDDTPNNRYSYFSGKHNFANTHYRRVSYVLDATTRYKEFFSDEIRLDEKNLKVTSPVKTGWVPNSAPPPPPSVLYVVPTFGWVRSNKGNKASSLRAGGGLRVYLDRPWMSTGFTEMLGVVLPHSSNSKPLSTAAADKKYAGSITMWGADPIWSNPDRIKSVSPSLSAFPLARKKAPITFEGTGFPDIEGTDLPPGEFLHTRLPHPDINDDDLPINDQIRLDVAPHVTGYDAERKLWYCDIVIRPPSGTYTPFVRLALARYNPISVWRAQLSSMVLTEFQQLTPDRLVIVTKNASASSAHIAVYGIAGQRTGAARTEPDRYKAVVQVLAAGGDPDLDWHDAKAPIPSRGKLQARPRVSQLVRPLTGSSALKVEAEQALRADKLSTLTARPDLMLALRPPLLWETDIRLPAAPSGGGRRILVTEKEHYRVEHDDLGATESSSLAPQISGRVVYLETLEL